MPGSGSPMVRRRRLAAELRRLRTESGRTADAVGELLGWSKAKVSRYELARSGLKPQDVERLLDVYGVRGEHREHLLALARDATERGWWEAYADVLSDDFVAYVGLEAEATSTAVWQTNVVPGLLQTERYARAVLSGYREVAAIAPGVIEKRVQVRLIRQRLLNQDSPLVLDVVIDESILQRQFGDRSVMYEQLQHLAAASEMPNVSARVVPLRGERKLAIDSFQVIHFGNAEDIPLNDVVSTENLHGYVYVEGEIATYDFRIAFESLREESLDIENSRRLILETAELLWKLWSDRRADIMRPHGR
jgi:transcriptional regulator with XRE-family HTH domain